MNKKGPNTAMVEKQDHDFYGLRILEGKYKDVIFVVGKVSFVENEERTECVLKYDFKIDTAPEQYSIEVLNESEDFKNTIGDILTDIFEETIDDAEESNRADTEQPST